MFLAGCSTSELSVIYTTRLIAVVFFFFCLRMNRHCRGAVPITGKWTILVAPVPRQARFSFHCDGINYKTVLRVYSVL